MARVELQGIRVVVLDMDNCLIIEQETRTGPEEIKDGAWKIIFDDFPEADLTEVIEKVKREIAGGKGDRWDIVRKVLAVFSGGKKVSEEMVRERVDRFGRMVREGSLKIGVPEEHRKMLRKWQEGGFRLAINTATPRSEAAEILEGLGVLGYFRSVHGRPETKVDGLRAILNEETAKPKEVVFVGDQDGDWLAAKEIGCWFVGMLTRRNSKWDNDEEEFSKIKSLAELDVGK
jgi:phosphoglycolate phosphatase-like HAD superfamily hydrolase